MKQSIKLLNNLRDELNDINISFKISDIIVSIINESSQTRIEASEQSLKEKIKLINELTKTQ